GKFAAIDGAGARPELRAAFRIAPAGISFRGALTRIMMKAMCPASSGMRTVSGCARILSWLIAAGLWSAAAVCPAQEPAAGEAPPSSRAEAPERPEETRPTPTNETPALPAGDYDLKYLEGPGGKAVYVPDKASLEEYLEWREQRNARAGKGPPGASVTSLLFEGSADDERALLTAVINVEVAADGEWVAVPLRMPEGTLRAPAVNTGQGLAVQAPFLPDEGYTCGLRGEVRTSWSSRFRSR